MAMPKCSICNANESKYRCPHCKIHYCSLTCFKSPEHNHSKSKTTPDTKEKPSVEKEQPSIAPEISDELFQKLKPSSQKLLLNDKLRSLLKVPQLQIQLLILAQIVNDQSLTNESSPEARREVAVKKLESLREDGVHSNELIEEFCLLFEDLYTQK